jgi:hypothetical protein
VECTATTMESPERRPLVATTCSWFKADNDPTP